MYLKIFSTLQSLSFLVFLFLLTALFGILVHLFFFLRWDLGFFAEVWCYLIRLFSFKKAFGSYHWFSFRVRCFLSWFDCQHRHLLPVPCLLIGALRPCASSAVSWPLSHPYTFSVRFLISIDFSYSYLFHHLFYLKTFWVTQFVSCTLGGPSRSINESLSLSFSTLFESMISSILILIYAF